MPEVATNPRISTLFRRGWFSRIHGHIIIVYINSCQSSTYMVLNSTGMDAFSVWHTNSSGQSAAIYAIKLRWKRVFIKTAANIIFLASDKFYDVLLVFYSPPIAVSSI